MMVKLNDTTYSATLLDIIREIYRNRNRIFVKKVQLVRWGIYPERGGWQEFPVISFVQVALLRVRKKRKKNMLFEAPLLVALI
jgi:hypothetical protein